MYVQPLNIRGRIRDYSPNWYFFTKIYSCVDFKDIVNMNIPEQYYYKISNYIKYFFLAEIIRLAHITD